MPRFDAIIASWEDAHAILQKPGGSNATHIVSIGEVGSPWPPAVRLSTLPKLRLEFDDMRFVTQQAEEEGLREGCILPSEEDVASLIRFLDRIESGCVLFHCAAGISRSAASALIFFALKLGPGRELEALERVRNTRRTRHSIAPNATMLAYADRLLDRKGALLRAARDYWQWSKIEWISSELQRGLASMKQLEPQAEPKR